MQYCYHSCYCCFSFALDTPTHAGTQAGSLSWYVAAKDACCPLSKSGSSLSTFPFCTPWSLLCVPVVREIMWTTLAFLTGYQAMYKRKSLPHCAEVIDWLEYFLCHTIKHPSSCSPLGCTVEQLHTHSVWPKLTEEKAIYWALNNCLMHSQPWANGGVSKGTYRGWFFPPQFGHNPAFT